MIDPEPSIFDEVDAEFEARREAEAEADIAQGRLVPHAAVAEWLAKIGTPDEEPMPAAWLK
ncbi:MAG TPA: antitoxin [Caulobacteraceae bacterium]|nr:antitoxin [Caulobacteraceae bacterium]